MANKIGRYMIQGKLGRGSMAQVYLVWDDVRKESVALKALLPNYVENPNIRRRFLREAAAIKRLPHKFIIPIYDFGESDGQVYYTMQALDGGTLGNRIEVGEIADETLLFYFERIAEAVDHIHKRGVVHRDIKPNNIIFNRFGRPFLADFGVIKLNKSRTTDTGSSFIGTPAYMSPEQVMSEEVDHRADLYTLGIVLFEMLTGSVPFEGDSVMETAQMQVNAAVPKLREFKPVDKRWQKVIDKALAKDPNRRYQSGGEMAAAVHKIVEGKVRKQKKTIQPAPVREKRPFNRLLLLPVAAMLLILVALIVSLLPLPRGESTVTPTEGTTATTLLIDQSTATLAPSESEENDLGVLSAVCQKEDGYDFELGEPEFAPELGGEYVDDAVPTVRYQVMNQGCPLITALIELESREQGTPIQAFWFEDGEEQEIDQLDEGSVGYLVLEFAPQTVEYLNDVWQFVIDDGGTVLELNRREKIEIQERWLRMEANEIGQLPIPSTNTPRPTSTQLPVNSTPIPTNTPFGTPSPSPSPSTSISTSTSTSTSTPTVLLTVPVTPSQVVTESLSPVPDWNATKTVEVAQTRLAETRTRQAADAQNRQTRTAEETRWATDATATSEAVMEQAIVVSTLTRQAQVENYNATQTREIQAENMTATAWAIQRIATQTAAAIRPTARPANTPVPTVWPTKTNTPRPAITAWPTNTPLPTSTPTPTELPFVVPVIVNPDICVIGSNGFVQTSFQWTGELRAGQSFAIRISGNTQNPQSAGQYVKTGITTGNNGTNWSVGSFESGFTAGGKNNRWTVAVLEQGQVLAYAPQFGCFDNTGGAG